MREGKPASIHLDGGMHVYGGEVYAPLWVGGMHIWITSPSLGMGGEGDMHAWW